MRKLYQMPRLTLLGDIAELTGIFGNAFTGDVLVDQNGNVVQRGNLSISACATRDFEECIAPPNP